MRQGQQGRRGRGRNNNNNNNNNNNQRKGQHHHNPLMRTFQSNGPDQKIHGTPAQIAEKYMTLARDALSSGDPVLAENYLQHAEHYNRIILTYREQQIQQQGGDPMSARPRQGQGNESFDVNDDGGSDDDADDGQMDAGGMQQPRGFEPQPPQRFGTDDRQNAPRQQGEGGREQGFRDREPGYQGGGHQRDGQPREGGFRGEGGHREGGQRQFRQQRMGGDRDQRQFADRQPRGDRQDRPQRVDRPEAMRGERYDRGERQERPDRPERNERPERSERPERNERPERAEAGMSDRGPVERAPVDRPVFDRAVEPPVPVADSATPPVAAEPVSAPAPRRRERFAEAQHEQPEFLRRPVRRGRREAAAAPVEPTVAPVVADEPGTRD